MKLLSLVSLSVLALALPACGQIDAAEVRQAIAESVAEVREFSQEARDELAVRR